MTGVIKKYLAEGVLNYIDNTSRHYFLYDGVFDEQTADVHRLVEDLCAENMELQRQIKTHEIALKLYERERERFRHAKPEITGEYFLAGGYGETDSNMLPQFVRICPAYGADWEQIYEKTDKTVNYEGS